MIALTVTRKLSVSLCVFVRRFSTLKMFCRGTWCKHWGDRRHGVPGPPLNYVHRYQYRSEAQIGGVGCMQNTDIGVVQLHWLGWFVS
jgi:hypothetical protein